MYPHNGFWEADRRKTGTLTGESSADFLKRCVSQIDVLYGSTFVQKAASNLHDSVRESDGRETGTLSGECITDFRKGSVLEVDVLYGSTFG